MQHFPLTQKLHTDVLEEKYGPIKAKVLRHNSKIREALMNDDKGIARSYAITFLTNSHDKEVIVINQEIKDGETIGRAFRNHNYTIRKNVVDVFFIKIPKWLKKAFKTKDKYAKVRLSEFYIKKENKVPSIYGIVTEVYTPEFRKPVINKVDKSQINALTQDLEKQGFTKEEIYNRIPENNYQDVQERNKKAKENSKIKIIKLRKIIEKEIKH